MEEKTYCEKWPTGCHLCDLLLCEGKKETAFKRQRSANNILFRMIGVNPMKCDPCKPTQPECGECEFAKPITNYDILISKTPEEMADWLCKILTYCGNRHCDPDCPLFKCCNDQPTDNIEGWLKSPVEEAGE